jgi:hypothetical protein
MIIGILDGAGIVFYLLGKMRIHAFFCGGSYEI